MAIQAPTRITIEIHPPSDTGDAPSAGPAQPVVVVTQHEDRPTSDVAPAAYETGPCTCLDDEDCGQDHGND